MPGTSTCTPHQVSFEGTVWVEAQVDLADALDLDTALSVGAARLADLGSTATLDVRRSEALGEMARHQLALDLDTTGDTGDTLHRGHPGARRRPAGGAACAPLRGRDHHPGRPAAPGAGGEHPLLRGRRPGPRLVRPPGTTVTVKPVVDLAEHLHVDQYQVPDRLADQATERDVTCVFPWCTRPAENCDLDHVIPYAEGGPDGE